MTSTDTDTANTQALALLIDAGLEFGQTVGVFAARQSDEAKAMIELARERWHEDGEIEIDDNAIAAGSADEGDYVMAWVWVDNPESDDDNDNEG